MGAGRADAALSHGPGRSRRSARRSRPRFRGDGRCQITFYFAHDLIRKPVPTFRYHALCRRALAAAADDELKIAQIDEHAERLPDDEHRVLAVECVALSLIHIS